VGLDECSECVYHPTTRFGSALLAEWVWAGQGGWLLSLARTHLTRTTHVGHCENRCTEPPRGEGNLLVRVPFDPNDLMHYYTIELRNADGWDAGILERAA